MKFYIGIHLCDQHTDKSKKDFQHYRKAPSQSTFPHKVIHFFSKGFYHELILPIFEIYINRVI